MRLIDNDKRIESCPGFCDEVAKESGQPIEACYQCGKCTAGCPLAPAMEMTPNQIIRAVQLGLRDLVLDTAAIWHCAACETCASRCPRDIDMARVNKALARRCVREGRKPKDPAVANFHKAFLDSMGRWGRAHEVELMSLTKAMTPSQRFKDIGLGAALFGHGKLNLLPHWVRQSKQVREILQRDRQESRTKEEACSNIE
jgi:heterodisulfide reductase subunit C2